MTIFLLAIIALSLLGVEKALSTPQSGRELDASGFKALIALLVWIVIGIVILAILGIGLIWWISAMLK